MGKLRIMSASKGDVAVEWDVDTESAVKEAERIFEEHRRQGATAFRTDDRTVPVKLDRFDPDAQQIVVIPRVAGG